MKLTKKQLEQLIYKIRDILRRHCIHDGDFGDEADLTGFTIQVLSDEEDYEVLRNFIYSGDKKELLEVIEYDNDYKQLVIEIKRKQLK